MSFGFDCFWKLPESSQSRPVATGLCGLVWTLRLWVATFQSDFGLVTLETSCLNGSLSEFLSGLGGTFRESQCILRLPVTLLLQNLALSCSMRALVLTALENLLEAHGSGLWLLLLTTNLQSGFGFSNCTRDSCKARLCLNS